MPCRQAGAADSLLRLFGVDWAVPDFSTPSRRQTTLAVGIPCRGSKGPLDLLADSTGFKVEAEGEWHACIAFEIAMSDNDSPHGAVNKRSEP